MISVELHKLWFNRGALFPAFSFFVFVLFCGSLALGYDPSLLKACASFLFWILAVLTTFFSTPSLLKSEAQNGLLDEVLFIPLHPAFFLLSRVMAEWIFFGLPLSILSFLMAPLFCFSLQEAGVLSLTLGVGFPALAALGLLGGLLTFQARGGGLLLPLLILPLALPLLLFALSVMEITRLGLDSFSHFCLLTSVSLLLVIIAVGAGSWALRFVGEG